MPVRPRFDPKRALIAARGFTFLGRAYVPGDPFPHPDDAPSIATRLLARQYEGGAVNLAPEAPADPITMTSPIKGRYEINAPWLEVPLTIRGKKNAEQALADIRGEGPPLGWIAGGTEVEIEQIGDDLYAITAPWLDAPEQIEGRAAAEARQREIHDAGAPAAPADLTPDSDVEGDDGASGASNAPDENAAKADTDGGEIAGDDATAGGEAAVAAENAAAAGQAEAAESEAGKSEDPPANP